MSLLSSFLNQANTGAVLAAMSRSLALIEFDTSGNILTANENFLRTMGYTLDDIRGKHHRMFLDPALTKGEEYRLFWERLANGKFESAEYRRLAKGGREVWLQGTYNPVLSGSGKVIKIIKIATDITREKVAAVEHAGKIAAISRAQAVIEFTTEGEILTANENFLSLLGYSLDEVRGRHHRMFVDPAQVQSTAYTQFWQRLRAGEFVADEFMRIGKDGRQVWIQASYNPILSPDGKVMKVVKFATDVTGRVHAVREIGLGLGKLAKGDLVCEIDQPFITALDPLRTDFNDSIVTLRRALQAVGDNTSSINTGIYQISQASQDLAKRTEQQAVSVEEAANSLTHITGTVQASARRAEEAGELVSRARDIAEQSEGVVRQAVAMMSEIEKSSKEIGNILGVIDEIAFQTNLLALNAGVEAARAGDAGRGFAVVAQEVRELAQRSASAAKEIKTLIARSGSQVTAGVGLVGETGKALATILIEVREVNRHVTAIVDAAREQTQCLEEISASVSIMDHNTRQNAAMVEESSTASSSLASEVVELNQQIEQFNLDRPATRAGNRRLAAA